MGYGTSKYDTYVPHGHVRLCTYYPDVASLEYLGIEGGQIMEGVGELLLNDSLLNKSEITGNERLYIHGNDSNRMRKGEFHTLS